MSCYLLCNLKQITKGEYKSVESENCVEDARCSLDSKYTGLS